MALSALDLTLDRIKQKYKELHGDTDFVAAIRHGTLAWADTTLTAAQVKLLNTTPIQLIAAPGAGLSVVPVKVMATMVYGTATYSCNASGASLFYTDGSGAQPGLTLTQAFIQQTASSSLFVNGAATAFVPTANAKIVIKAATSDPTTGDSPIKIRVYYHVVANPLPSY